MADFSLEIAEQKKGAKYICGVDEAGRGPLAGPVVVACVMFKTIDVTLENLLKNLDDSKKLSPQKRKQLFNIIINKAYIGISSIEAKIIDEKNILQATFLGMQRAINSLFIKPSIALIDGRDIPDNLSIKAKAVIKGDSKSLSIAAASVIAKQVRDEICYIMAQDFPEFNFEKHKGYGTKAHIEALSKFGPSPYHRFSYAPVRAHNAIKLAK